MALETIDDVLDAFGLSDSDKGFIQGQAFAKDKTVTDFVRDIILEHLEDQQDLAKAREITSRPDYGEGRLTHDEVLKELGLWVI